MVLPSRMFTEIRPGPRSEHPKRHCDIRNCGRLQERLESRRRLRAPVRNQWSCPAACSPKSDPVRDRNIRKDTVISGIVAGSKSAWRAAGAFALRSETNGLAQPHVHRNQTRSEIGTSEKTL